MQEIPRRLARLSAFPLVLLALGVSAPGAHAALDAGEQPPPEAALTELVERRALALGELERKANARDRVLAGRQAVLAQYGYTGDPDAVTRVLPLASYDVSAEFGRTGPLWEADHGGQDFSASTGDTLVAVAAGTVTDVSYAGPYGLRTILTLADGTEIWYCHQSATSVRVGRLVDVADVLGQVGSTGNSVGPHLHLEVRPEGGSPIDPMDWLREAGLDP